MATLEEIEVDGDSIRVLGPLFKLTRVYLCADSSTKNQRSWQLPKHIRFKYDDDDDNGMEEELEAGIGKVGSHESSETLVTSDALPADIVQQMNSMGLPLSFKTNQKIWNEETRSEKRVAPNSATARLSVQKDNLVAELCAMPWEDEEDVSDGEGKILNDVTSLCDAETCDLHKHEKFSGEIQINDGSIVEDIGSDITPKQPQYSDMPVDDGDGSYCFIGSLGDWHVLWDSHYMTNYFYNVKTQESTWHAPPGMESYVQWDLSSESYESTINRAGMDVTTNDCRDGKYSVSEFEGDLGEDTEVEMKPELYAVRKGSKSRSIKGSYESFEGDLGEGVQVEMKPELYAVRKESKSRSIKGSYESFEGDLGEGVQVEMKPELYAVRKGSKSRSIKGSYESFEGDLGEGVQVEMKPELYAVRKESKSRSIKGSYESFEGDLGEGVQVEMKLEDPEPHTICREDIASTTTCRDKLFEGDHGEGVVVDLKPDGLFGDDDVEGVVVEMKPELYTVSSEDTSGTNKRTNELFEGDLSECIVEKMKPEQYVVGREDTAGSAAKRNCEFFESEPGEGVLVEMKPELYAVNREDTAGFTKSNEGDIGEGLQVEMMSELLHSAGQENSAGITKRKKKTRRKRSWKKSSENYEEQLFECSVESYSGGIGKYWCQRYQLFTKFDEGIQMDEEGWFSVTPEVIARHQASRCQGSMIIDLFAGVGGNAIQFAMMGKNVIAIDIDPNKIEFASHNAGVYGVKDQIDFVLGDCFSLAPTFRADTVFLSPPWGGPDYLKAEVYDLTMLKPFDGKTIFDTFKEISSMIVMFLPRNVDLDQLAEVCLSVDPPWSVEVEQNYLNGKFKAITAYFCKTSAEIHRSGDDC